MKARGLAAWLVVCCAGAAPAARAARPWIGAPVLPQPSREDLLDRARNAIVAGDLGAAGAALTTLADRERGRPDSALDYWCDLLAFLRCEPMPQVPRIRADNPPLIDPWERLRRVVQIDRVRLARKPDELADHATVLADGAAGARPATGPSLPIRWPLERERWPDEAPVPVLLSRCAVGSTGLAQGRPERATDAEVAFVSAVAGALPPAHPAAAPLWLQAAVLDLTHGRPANAVSALAHLDAAGGATAPELELLDRRTAVLAAALAAIDDPAVAADRVLAAGRASLRLDLPPASQRGLALLLAERLDAAQRPDDAIAILGPPPHGEDPIGRYIAFRQAQAHARANRGAELLAEAREALNRHTRAQVDADPALGAIMDMALRTLRASPVSAETMEVLEALGPPRERLTRAEAFASAALDGGAPLAAMATFNWLHDNDPDSARQLRHLARTCVAAARAGARAEFARTFRLLAGQDNAADGSKSPKGALIASSEADAHREKRVAARSLDWQQALLVVARDALPALVENDDQVDLATLVATLKRHLDEAGRGPVDDELTTLYRAASAHLKTGARAYAETVGAPRRPILLGQILVGRNYDVRRPPVDMADALTETGPLVYVPRSGHDPREVERWHGFVRVLSEAQR